MKTLTTFVLGWLLLVSTAVAALPRQVVVLHVDAAAAPGGNGTGAAPFQNLPEAVTEARTLWRGGVPRIIIQVEPGVYLLTATLTLDVPDLELRGSNMMEVDADGWPTGALEPGTETKITVASPMSGPLIKIEPSDGALTGHGVTVAHVTVDANSPVVPLGTDVNIQIHHSQGFTVKGCIITGWSFIGINPAASSGTVVGNYITNVGCGTCIGGGNADSPADVTFVGNRSVDNQFGGVQLTGGASASGNANGIFDTLSVTIKNNDLSRHTRSVRMSFGVRIVTIRRDPPDPKGQGNGHVTAAIVGNRIHDNELPFSIDAGFPYRTFNQVCDPRTYTGTFDLSIKDNDIWGNRLPSLITFTRSTAAIRPNQLNPTQFANSWKYLHGATFVIHDPQGNLAGYWFDHRVADPLDPSADYCGEAGTVLDNTLIVNGSVIPPGRNIPSPVP